MEEALGVVCRGFLDEAGLLGVSLCGSEFEFVLLE
jgi:hypothetical protein